MTAHLVHRIAAMHDRPSTAAVSRRVWAVLGNVLAMAGVLFVLWEARTVIGWILVALLLALGAASPVRWLVRHRVPRGLAIAVVVTSGLALVVATFATLVPMLVDQARQLVLRAPELIDRFQHTRPVVWLDQRFGVVGRVQEGLQEWLADFATTGFSVASSLVRVVVATIAVVFLTVFALLFGDDVFESALRWIPPDRRAHVRDLATRMHTVVSGFVVGTLIVAALAGTVMGVTLALLGAPYFVALGLLTALCALIPYVGGVVAALLISLVTLATTGLRAALTALVVYLVYQQIEGNLIQPIVQRRTIRMNALLVSVALLIGTALGGILGTLLALPVAGALQVVLGDVLARRRERWGERGTEPELRASAPSTA